MRRQRLTEFFRLNTFIATVLMTSLSIMSVPTCLAAGQQLKTPPTLQARKVHKDPRIAEFNRELATYQRKVAVLYREVQRLQAHQRRLNTLARQLQTIGDDAQMMQLQLQAAMQKQTQAMQMLSSILKSMHDTERSIIRNIK